MHNFKELKVWQKSVDLAVDTYYLTKYFPSEERFGLVQQINRSAVSVASNIAEGAGRNNFKEFNNFLGIASGSSCELETQYIIAHRIGLIDSNDFEVITSNVNEIQKMIFKLQQSLPI
ncbi:four helix bundle protein [Runella slithyformis]|uniref:S23 ribosomal protein n=1 Tax=Runella slithyformis (strain ATCC 29530 / DSM 19594 / LMG 11500 / NCIMB 11436 / LSU 4) TaxID=761193 RepID=A0A7U4E6V8_RUNSL|nr:four helix bundle protein [Runella slithyformis]AEI50013.1 S23 ribosomal protein [Runella slithyformis DSM 19594]